MNIQDNGTRAALFQALRTPGLSLDSLNESDATAAVAGSAATSEAAPQSVAADPAEALLKLDVWPQQPSRYLQSDSALPSFDGGSRADQLADHVLSALG